MRNVFSTLARGVSVAAVVVFLTVPTAHAAMFGRGDREQRGAFQPPLIVKIIKHLVGAIWGDEVIVPHP